MILSSKNKQPNVLMIMADQLAAAMLPAYGHPLVRTPNLDRLAAAGTIFENAYCNFPLCVPSRASMLAGRLSSSIEVWDNASEASAEIPMMGHFMRSLGYTATLCGKMHFVGPDQMHGFETRGCTDIYPANFAWTPDWLEGPRNRPTGINMRAVIESGVGVRTMQIDYDEEVEYSAVQKLYDLVRYADDKPFFLTVSFTQPHSPFVTTRKYWDLYRHEDIDMPAVDPIPLDESDVMSQWLYYAHGGDLDTVTDDHVRNARHAYYGMISYIDAKVGRLLDVLDEIGQADDTMVVFTADHGEMLGERGMWYKQAFFENSARIPLIVRAPGVSQQARIDDPVSLLDLLPTFIDVAGGSTQLAGDAQLEGESLLPRIRGESRTPERDVISEYTGEGVCSPCRMVRQGRYKFIYTHGHPDQLYDLETDPLELDNLAGATQTTVVEAALRARILDGWDPEAILGTVLDSQRRRRFIHETTGGCPTWALEIRHDDAQRYVRNSGAVQAKAKARFPQPAAGESSG